MNDCGIDEVGKKTIGNNYLDASGDAALVVESIAVTLKQSPQPRDCHFDTVREAFWRREPRPERFFEDSKSSRDMTRVCPVNLI